MAFDFQAAVHTPFRMQPGLRRMAPHTPHLTPAAPGSVHQREKLAVLSRFADDALAAVAGFDAAPSLHHLCTLAAREHPQVLGWDGHTAQARQLGFALRGELLERTGSAPFGQGDEVPTCLAQLPAHWRLAGLMALLFEQDLALLDPHSARVPWMAVCLPSHWAPKEKVGLDFGAIHAPVADNAALLRASASLMQLVGGGERWERFVWTLTDHPRLHAHPKRVPTPRWSIAVDAAAAAGPDANAAALAVGEHSFLRTEWQTFVPPLRPGAPVVFTIHVQVRPLPQALLEAQDAQATRSALHDSLASMTVAVQGYRSLAPVHHHLVRYLSSTSLCAGRADRQALA